ncbi:sensitivity to high expression protein she9 [Coemansia brasiliensis]|uniref:Sensitive to high expression protein 9, mitochondrial n=1 Tax=Coemansia brasiliensis TaxID=2650707 RepID=A0A9W8IBE3_9FUNG|nr:sensitivity to high expression protein she9 [Coemansia brasiliensis]
MSKASGADQKALVPLNIIYLEPPKWHQPLKICKPNKQKSTEKLSDHTEGSGSWIANAIKDRTEFASDNGSKDKADYKSQSVGIFGRIARMFGAQTQTPAVSNLAGFETADKEQPRPEKNATNDEISRVTAEKWQGSAAYRILGAWRRTLVSLKSLPKDDNWITWAGKALNEITGYDRIALLRMQVDTSGNLFHEARQHLNETKARHSQAAKTRLANQREINSLLQRKHLWTEDDVARFTSLYRDEYQAESTESQAAKELKDAEALVDHRYDELVNAIRGRYHEEQIWSDKIRRASTYGTWAVLFMNILALFMAQAIFEPRKRRKIIAGVDERLSESMSEQQARLEDTNAKLQQQLADQEQATSQIARHLYNMSAAMDLIAQRQEAELSMFGSQIIDTNSQPSSSPSGIDPSVLLGGDKGFSDTELDMYYAQLQDHPRQSLIPGSVIWKVASAQQSGLSRAEAGQLALETAAITSLIAGAIAYWISVVH